MKRLIFTASLLLLTIAVIGPATSGTKQAAQKQTAKKQPAAKAKLPPVKPGTAATIKAQIAANKGKGVLVNFWATWCLPCQQEFPHLVKLQRQYAKQGLVVIFVSADEEADIKTKVQPFLRQNGGTGSWIIKDNLSEFIEQYEPELEDAFDLPRNYLYNREGKQVEIFGEVDLKGAEAKVKLLF